MNLVNVNSSMLSYNARFKRFVGEISQVSRTVVPSHIRIDSNRTRRAAEFFLASEQRDRENEVLYWIYNIDPADAKTLGISNHTQIMLFND